MTYEYVCTECGHEWEADQRISEPALSDCPSCKRATAKRLVTGGMGFVLKGSGWYSDLYGLKPKGGGGGGELGAPKAKSESKADSEASSTATASESKPSEATSSESKPPASKKESSASAA